MQSRGRAVLAVLLVLLSGWTLTSASADAAVSTEAPRRVLDTRIGLNAGIGRLNPGTVLKLEIDGVAQRGQTAVMLNLTSDQAQEPGFVAAWPCDEPPTDTSILNVFPGRAIPNAVALEYSSAGVCFSSTTPVHLIADLTGVTDSGDFRATAPSRRFDSREGRRLAAGEVRRFRIAGRNGVSFSAAAAAINVTVVHPAADGFVLVEPCGGGSSASTMNFRRGEIVPHFTFSALDDGDVCVTSLVETDLVIDVFGWMEADSAIELIRPNRALDTRTGFGGHRGGLRDGQLVAVQVGGAAGTRVGATNAVVNIVGVDASALGFLNAWPCDRPEPNSSVVNLWPGAVRANQAVVTLSGSGTLCVRAMLVDSSRVDVVVDVVGYTGGTGDPVPPPVDPPAGRFGTLPVGAALPSGAECAARVRPAAEVRPENAAANSNRGSRANANNRTDWSGFDRVDGDYAGTTDEIIQWAACKWGIDEDIARAQVVKESFWYQSANGDNGESWGLGQVRDTAHQSAFEYSVNAINSSAYNLDYTYAVWRGCFEGVYTWLNTVERGATYGPGDAWGCTGVWFSGRWYTAAAIRYIEGGGTGEYGDIGVKQHLSARTWETASFING